MGKNKCYVSYYFIFSVLRMKARALWRARQALKSCYVFLNVSTLFNAIFIFLLPSIGGTSLYRDWEQLWEEVPFLPPFIRLPYLFVFVKNTLSSSRLISSSISTYCLNYHSAVFLFRIQRCNCFLFCRVNL